MQVMYARMEEADALIESLMQDKDPNLRQSGMYTVAMAYCGTGNNKAIKRLLHVAVRTRGCRFFLWRRHTTALFKKILLHNNAARPCHAFMHIMSRILSRNGLVAQHWYTPIFGYADLSRYTVPQLSCRLVTSVTQRCQPRMPHTSMLRVRIARKRFWSSLSNCSLGRWLVTITITTS